MSFLPQLSRTFASSWALTTNKCRASSASPRRMARSLASLLDAVKCRCTRRLPLSRSSVPLRQQLLPLLDGFGLMLDALSFA